jgi:hypothetical protein
VTLPTSAPLTTTDTFVDVKFAGLVIAEEVIISRPLSVTEQEEHIIFRIKGKFDDVPLTPLVLNKVVELVYQLKTDPRFNGQRKPQTAAALIHDVLKIVRHYADLRAIPHANSPRPTDMLGTPAYVLAANGVFIDQLPAALAERIPTQAAPSFWAKLCNASVESD